MFGAVLAIVVLLWVTLAVAVAFHARGHDRSGIIWFCIVAVTGVFGLAFYLLAVTSRNAPAETNGRELDSAIAYHVPRTLLTATVGVVSVTLVLVATFTVVDAVSATRGGAASLSGFAEQLAILGALAGLLGGPAVFYRAGWRRFGYVLSHVVVLLAVVGILNKLVAVLPGAERAVPGNGLLAFVVLVGLEAAVVTSWARIYDQRVRHLGWGDLTTAYDESPVDVSRRQALAALGGVGVLGLAGVAYHTSRPTVEDVRIESIRTAYESTDPVVYLTVTNPVTEQVVVEVDVWVEDSFTNDRGDTYTNSVSKTVTRTLPPATETEVSVRFGDEKTDFGRRNPGIGAGFEVDEDLTSVEPLP